MSKRYEIKPLVDVGSAIKEAEKTAGKSIRSTQHKEKYVTAIRVRTKAGQLTCSAQNHFDVDLVIGPSDISGEFNNLENFASCVRAVKLHFNPFKFSDSGKISRGSLTLKPLWRGVCRSCGVVVKASDVIKQSRGKSEMKCRRCNAVGKFSKQAINPKSAPDNVVNALYTTYTAGCEASNALALPRVWSLYREGMAPTAWLPPADDTKAIDVAVRASNKGMEIRPASHAIMSQSKATAGFVMEGTSGFNCGWLSKDALTGCASRSCGYKLQARQLFSNSFTGI